MRTLRSQTGKSKVLKPVRPNLELAARYHKRLDTIITGMSKSVLRFIPAAYRRFEPEMTRYAQDGVEMVRYFAPDVYVENGIEKWTQGGWLAQDASPAADLQEAIRKLRQRWQRHFNRLARDMAKWFATNAAARSQASLQHSLRQGGFSVRFTNTRTINDVLQATIAENVSLIRSIPEQYFTQIEGMVMRSVQSGRDLRTLTDDIQNQYGVTRRRAALIARDQNNKATSNINRTRLLEIGITQARWQHSAAGKEPRPTHVKASRDKVIFNLAEGWWDPHEEEFVLPGQLINCRCFAVPILPTE